MGEDKDIAERERELNICWQGMCVCWLGVHGDIKSSKPGKNQPTCSVQDEIWSALLSLFAQELSACLDKRLLTDL